MSSRQNAVRDFKAMPEAERKKFVSEMARRYSEDEKTTIRGLATEKGFSYGFTRGLLEGAGVTFRFRVKGQ